LCAANFDWAPLLEDPRFLLACARPTERTGLAAALESLRVLVGFADDIVTRVFGDRNAAEYPDLAATLRCLAADRMRTHGHLKDERCMNCANGSPRC
jgi:hypothetical protein